MRGENRDYIPTRQSGVKDKTCGIEEGCAFKAESQKRGAPYREYLEKGERKPMKKYNGWGGFL